MKKETTIFGYSFEAIRKAQQGDTSLLRSRSGIGNSKDYGADPIGDGTFRMIPSGDIVTLEERNRRLGK